MGLRLHPSACHRAHLPASPPTRGTRGVVRGYAGPGERWPPARGACDPVWSQSCVGPQLLLCRPGPRSPCAQVARGGPGHLRRTLHSRQGTPRTRGPTLTQQHAGLQGWAAASCETRAGRPRPMGTCGVRGCHSPLLPPVWLCSMRRQAQPRPGGGVGRVRLACGAGPCPGPRGPFRLLGTGSSGLSSPFGV